MAGYHISSIKGHEEEGKRMILEGIRDIEHKDPLQAWALYYMHNFHDEANNCLVMYYKRKYRV